MIRKRYRGKRASGPLSIVTGAVILLAILSVGATLFKNPLSRIPRLHSAPYGKSIAVLPFTDTEQDRSVDYFLEGTMEDIVSNLCKIEDLRIIYLNQDDPHYMNMKRMAQLGEKLHVSYFLRAGWIKEGDRAQLNVQLSDGQDRKLWSKTYNWEIREAAQAFSLQNEISEQVAKTIRAVITPEEQQRIDNIPTQSLSAVKYYRQGKQELNKFERGDRSAIDKARTCFQKALELDSTYALAYAGLGRIHYEKYYRRGEILNPGYLDSVYIYINKSLSFNDQLAEIYQLRGWYVLEVEGDMDRSLADFNRAIELNSNNHEFYNSRGVLHLDFRGDFISGIEDLEKSLSLYSGPDYPYKLGNLGNAYRTMGFFDISDYYFRQKLSLDGDSASYYADGVLWTAYVKEDMKAVLEAEEIVRKFKPDYSMYGFIAIDAGLNDRVIEGTNRYLVKYRLGEEEPALWAYADGYGLWLMGRTEEAEKYFNIQIETGEEIIDYNRAHARYGHSHIDMTKVYAFTGHAEKALDMLDELADYVHTVPQWMLAMIRQCPMIDPIREEHRYQEVMQKLEASYLAEHRRVKKWLEESGRMNQFGL